MSSIGKLFCAISMFVLPSRLSVFALNSMGHKVAKGSRIGFSWIYADKIVLSHSAKVGHLNYISAKRLVMRDDTRIGRANIVNGPVSIHLLEASALGNSNKITRGAYGVVYGPARIRLGKLSKITANHRVDCSRSVMFGNYSTLGGVGSQIWTHGYIHEAEGPGRYRVDGTCVIGNNVYIGSMALISAGVKIGSGSIVGAGTVVSKDLEGNFMYVPSAVRKLPRPSAPDEREGMQKVPSNLVIETVYKKKKVV